MAVARLNDRHGQPPDFGGPPIGGYPLADAPKQRWLNRSFQFLGGPEGDLLAGLDFFGLISSRISAHPRDGPEPGGCRDRQTDFAAVLEVAGGQSHQVAQANGLLTEA